MQTKIIIKEERISIIKRAKHLKDSIIDGYPKDLIKFMNDIEHTLKNRLKKIEKEIDQKTIVKFTDEN